MNPVERMLQKLELMEKSYPLVGRSMLADIMLAGAALILEAPSQQILIELRKIAGEKKGAMIEGSNVQSAD